MKISVLVPCYNEAETVVPLLQSVFQTGIAHTLEVIAVNDGSTDNTGLYLQSLERSCSVHVISHAENLGKGAALKSAIKAMSGDIAIIQDSDLEYSPGDYERLIQPILDDRADIVGGIRFIADSRHRYRGHQMFNRFISACVKKSTGLNVSDALAGLKAFRAHPLKQTPLQENRFAIDIEILCKMAAHNKRYLEIPIRYHPRSYAQGKKISALDSLKLLTAVWRYARQPI